MDSGRLIIICGLPGAGKTTLAKSLESQLRAVRFSPDEWMDNLDIKLWDERRRAKVEELRWRLAQQLLKLGLTVIIEWGTWGRSERDTLRLGARALGAAVELHYLAVPADLLFDRIHRRGMEDPPIDRHQLQRWYDAFQAPTSEESCSSTRRSSKVNRVKKVPSEPYPELDLVLETFTAGVQNALKENLCRRVSGRITRNRSL